MVGAWRKGPSGSGLRVPWTFAFNYEVEKILALGIHTNPLST